MSRETEITKAEERHEYIEQETHFQHQPYNKPKDDDAANIINNLGHSLILTKETNTRVLRRIDLRLLPILLGIYFLQQIDKTTLSYASVFGLIEDSNLHGQQYSWLGSVVYLSQLVVQPLVAYILVKVPLGKFLAVTTLLWGIALTCMTPSDTFAKLLVCRLFLGAFEAGIREFPYAFGPG